MDSPGPDCVPGASAAFRSLLPAYGSVSPARPRTADAFVYPAGAQGHRGNAPPCARLRVSYPEGRLDLTRGDCEIQFPGNGRLQRCLPLPGFRDRIRQRQREHALQGSLEARALFAVAEFCRENPEVEGNVVIDHFQGTEFRNLLESNQAALLDTKLEAEHMEVHFHGALERLQDKQRHQRFEALRVKPSRTPEEETEMLRLLRERNQVPASPSNNAIISGSRSTP